MRRFFHRLHSFFIPSEYNHYRARGLHLDVLTSLLGFAVILSFATGTIKSYVLGVATDITIQRLYERTNEIRTQNGLPPLKYNNTLANAAASKASDMFAKNYWAHYGPNGETPWSFITSAGYQYEFAGENLAQGFMFSDGVVDAWMASPTHRANIMRGEYDDVGYAVMNGMLEGEEVTLVVQMFGKQVAQAPQVVKTAYAEELPLAANEAEENTDSGITPTAPQKEKTLNVDTSIKLSDALLTQTSSETSPPKGSFIGLNQLSFDASLGVLGILLLVLVVDLYFAHRLNLLRLTGKNIAHIVFVFTVIIGILILKNGAIL